MDIFMHIIIPTFNASGTIRSLIEQLEKELAGYVFRILLVDDASTDNTREIISSLVKEYPNIQYLFIPKNRGQQAALLAGLKLITEPCRYVLTMDDDLQNPVSVIPSLIQEIESGYDLVYAVSHSRSGTGIPAPSAIRRLGSRFRDLLFDSFTHKPRGIRVSAFRILTYELAMMAAKSDRRFFYLSAETFQYAIRTANVAYEYVPRPCGRSSYHLGKLLLVYCKLFVSYKLKLF